MTLTFINKHQNIFTLIVFSSGHSRTMELNIAKRELLKLRVTEQVKSALCKEW